MKYEIDTDTCDIWTQIVPSTNSGYHWPRLAQQIARKDNDTIIEGHRIHFTDKDGIIVAKFFYDEPADNKTICKFIEKIQDWFSNRMTQLEDLIGDLELIQSVKEAQQNDD